jgi:hypothetical protein
MPLYYMSMVIIPKVISRFLLLSHDTDNFPKDVAKAMDVAFQYRNYFKKDVIVDLLVYRRW